MRNTFGVLNDTIKLKKAIEEVGLAFSIQEVKQPLISIRSSWSLSWLWVGVSPYPQHRMLDVHLPFALITITMRKKETRSVSY